jgi:hypothetical protein
MTSQLVCAYQATAVGIQSAAALRSALAAVPVDTDFLRFWGLRVATDVTALSSNTATRSITLAMGPSSNAMLTATLFGGDPSGSPLKAVSVSVQGTDYVRPPVITVAPPGDGVTAIVFPEMALDGVNIVAAGSGYTAATHIVVSRGALDPDGAQAVITATVFGGAIVATSIVTNGGPYNESPTLTVVDPGGGVGAVLTPSMGIANVVITNPGVGYVMPPALTVTPYFKSVVPDTIALDDQAAAVEGFMTEILSTALRMPVIPLDVVVS